MPQKRFPAVVSVVLVFVVASFAQPKKPRPRGRVVLTRPICKRFGTGWLVSIHRPKDSTTRKDRTLSNDIAAAQIQQLGRVPEKASSTCWRIFKSAKFTVNDDAEIYPAGDHAWGFATVKEDATMKSGKREVATIRWTFVFEKQVGKWLIVHEHVSEPLQ